MARFLDVGQCGCTGWFSRRAGMEALLLLFLLSAAVALWPRIAWANPDTGNAEELLAKGWAEFGQHNVAAYVRAYDLFQKAESAGPNNPDVHTALAYVYWRAYEETWTNQIDVGFSEARRLAESHIDDALQAPSARTYEVDCRLNTFRTKYEDALEACRRAIALDDHDAEIRHATALTYIYMGKPDKALEQVQVARRLAPDMEGYHGLYAGMAHFFAGDMASAVAALDAAINANPKLWSLEGDWRAALCHPCIFKIAALAQLDRLQEAKMIVDALMESHFGFQVSRELYFRPLAREQDVLRLRSGPLKARLPE